MQYTVSVDPDSHELTVEILIKGEYASGESLLGESLLGDSLLGDSLLGDSLLLETPDWVPGDYTFMQFARDIFSISAEDNQTGAALTVTRDGWQGFRIHNPTGDITVRYKAYAYVPEFGEPSGILDSTYGVLLGNRYLYSKLDAESPRVTYQLPDAWANTIHHPSGALKISGLNNTWEYPDYEILLDTPVIMGEYDIFERDVKGTPFYFVFVDRGVGFATMVEKFVDDVARVCEFFYTMYGSFPFEDYTFVLSLNPQNDWGLEHLTSTMCGLGPDVFVDEDQYNIGVRVCAHELFHAWNVRRLRPAPLLQLHNQLNSGSFSEGLWVAEGFTRYYEFLSCTVTGVYTPEQFFSNIVGYFEHLTHIPAYHRVSAVDSSEATYLNHSPKYPGRVCNCIDYYDKGMLIAFGIDATLRLSGDSGGLNQAFSAFYHHFVDWPVKSDNPGYTNQDVINFFEAIQPGLGEQVDRQSNLPGQLNTVDVLKSLGFTVVKDTKYQLGLVFTDDFTTIYNLLDDMPGGQSGLAPMDVITHINGYSVTNAGLLWAAAQNQPVTLDVLRGHRKLSFTMTPAERTVISRLIWHGDANQKQLIQEWLGNAFNVEDGQEFSVSFYENFHGIETII